MSEQIRHWEKLWGSYFRPGILNPYKATFDPHVFPYPYQETRVIKNEKKKPSPLYVNT